MNNEKNSKHDNMDNILQVAQRILDDLGIDANRIQSVRADRKARAAASPTTRVRRPRLTRPPQEP